MGQRPSDVHGSNPDGRVCARVCACVRVRARARTCCSLPTVKEDYLSIPLSDQSGWAFSLSFSLRLWGVFYFVLFVTAEGMSEKNHSDILIDRLSCFFDQSFPLSAHASIHDRTT